MTEVYQPQHQMTKEMAERLDALEAAIMAERSGDAIAALDAFLEVIGDAMNEAADGRDKVDEALAAVTAERDDLREQLDVAWENYEGVINPVTHAVIVLDEFEIVEEGGPDAAGRNLVAAIKKLHSRAVAAEAESAALHNAALPFDNALGEDEPSYPDSAPVTLAFGAVRDFSLTLGDLRRLRAVLQEQTHAE